MFNGKKIKKLEQTVAQLKGEMADAQAEIARLRGVTSMLTEESIVTQFDADDYVALFAESDGGREKVEKILRTKEIYEKKLRKFIRSVINKKKMVKTDINKNGKDQCKTAE